MTCVDWFNNARLHSAPTVEEGSTFVRRREVVVSVPAYWTRERAANALAHELGHIHDVLYLDARSRDAFMRARGLNWVERYVTVKWPSFSSRQPRRRQRCASEDFAEVFAARWGPVAEFVSAVRPRPSEWQLAELEAFLVPRS